MNIIITFAAAGFVGFLFYKLRIPGAMMIGAVCGTVLLSLTLRCAAMPYAAKFSAQVTAGAFIGCSVEKSDLLQLRNAYRPALVVLGSFLLLNFSVGLLLWRITDIDLLTALLCAVPGGMSDLTLTAADMGADISHVVVLQFVRLCAGIGLFPSWIVWLDRKFVRKERAQSETAFSMKERKKSDSPPAGVLCILLSAGVCGFLGRCLRLPAGALIFSMMGSLFLKMTVLPVSLPRWIKRLAQILSGAYIGCSVSYDSLMKIHTLLIPAMIIVFAYMLNALLVGNLLFRRFCIPFREAMLMATPAGASDMALISADIGVQSPILIVVQILRMLAAAAIFPQICYQAAILF